jgi:polyhydroxyalkanoate synthesis regulator phasin
MIEQIKKGVLTGIGLGLMTSERVLEFARKSAKEAHLSTKEASELADELPRQINTF